MTKLLFVFVLVFSLFFFGITAFRTLTGKEKWALTKLVAYSILCAVLTVIALSLFVFAF